MLAALARPTTVLLAACALGGCSDLREEPRGDLFVRGALLFTREDNCRMRRDPDAPLLLFGVMDQAFVPEYGAFLLVGNKIPDDARGVSLHSANVTLEDGMGEIVNQFTTDTSGFVDPPAGGAAGFGVTHAVLIPAGSITPPERVTARVRMVGKIAGGADVESSELTFPIEVCEGCLVSFPPDARDPATGMCFGSVPPDEEPCILGQDAPVDCRLCTDNPACGPGF
jgi:hypothetical protein